MLSFSRLVREYCRDPFRHIRYDLCSSCLQSILKLGVVQVYIRPVTLCAKERLQSRVGILYISY